MINLSDEQLVKLYLDNNDDRALEQLIKRYLPQIYGYVRNYTGNRDNAADISQEVFVKVWQNIKRFDQSKSFKTWIFTIAKRTAIDELRRRHALPFSLLGEDENPERTLEDTSPSIIDQIFSRQESERLAFAIGKLPKDYNYVISAYVNEGLRFREIAEALGESINTVKSRYRRGLALLRKYL